MDVNPRWTMMRRVHISLMIAVLALLTATQGPNAQYVGSKRSDKYHRSSCGYAQRIHVQNVIEWSSVNDAISEGYIACRVCKPGGGAGNAVYPTTTNGGVRYIPVSAQHQSTTRCIAITQKGTQCKRNAKAASYYCWQHGR
jgi:methylphosphotriester-DNA--protein-cysteine methyltransferase